MVERSEADPKPTPTTHGSSEEERYLAAATKFKFLGFSPVSIFISLCRLYPQDFRDEFQAEMVDTFKLLLGERLEQRPGSVPLYLLKEYTGSFTSSIAMRFEKIRLPRST